MFMFVYIGIQLHRYIYIHTYIYTHIYVHIKKGHVLEGQRHCERHAYVQWWL